MTNRFPNLEFRGRTFYYRVAFSLNRKKFAIRLSLDTADPVVARERGARLDRVLKRRWREMATADTICENDRVSIMRAAARDARDSFEVIEGGYLDEAFDDPEGGRYEHRQTLRGLELVVRDIYANGLQRDFGSRLYEMHLIGGRSDVGREELARLREVIEGAGELADGFRGRAEEALRIRNVPVTSVNVALAARQVALGTLVALRDAMSRSSDPLAALDTLLAGLEMPVGETPGAGCVPPAGQGSAGVPSEPPGEASTPSMANAPRHVGPAAMSVREASEAYLAAHPKYDDGAASSLWTPKTRSQFVAAVFLAQKFFGAATPVGDMGENGLADFVRALRRLPRSHHKTQSHAEMSLAEIAEAGSGDRLHSVTINRHVRFVRQVLDWAWKRMPSPPVVDWSAFLETDRRSRRDKRPAFTAGELRTIFAGAVWTGGESSVRRLKPGRHVWWDAAYWVLVLIVYTGARREEIAKLAVDDVEELEGIWAIRIRETESGRVKNIASRRDVPLAEEVVRLGFLAFVERQRSGGEVLLFPELRRETATMGDYFYKKWWRAFERAGLVPPGKDIHSIRHYVSTALAEADVSEERRADLLGHTLASETAGTYTKRASMAALKAVVELLPKVTEDLTALG